MHLEATMLGQLESRMKMMSGGSKLCFHRRLAGPRLAPYKPPGPSQHSHVADSTTPRPSKTLPVIIWDIYKFINQIALGQTRRATGLAHPWWEHVFGHLEAIMLGQLGGRMKMMPGGPKLCSHHRHAGPSLALREGDHTMGGAIDTATQHHVWMQMQMQIWIWMQTNAYLHCGIQTHMNTYVYIYTCIRYTYIHIYM